jgi:hypothetical protein
VAWRTPEELVEIGFGRSPVVMANEFHNGMLRCVRTREVGRRLLPVAHDCGVRHLAMEALGGPYVEQPDLKALIDDALALGWTLIPYETDDPRSPFLPDGGVDWEIVVAREEDQARKIVAALPDTPLLVWCGNSHLQKTRSENWTPMGWFFRELSGIDQFALDQSPRADEYAQTLRSDLEPFGGTAGMLVEDLPDPFCSCGVDAMLFSLDNQVR